MATPPHNPGGVRCPSRGRVSVRPQIICIVCFVETDGWVEVSTEGVLWADTWVRKPKPHHPSVSPLINRVIRVGGVDNNMIHLAHTDDPGALDDGIRVRAIFSEKRAARIIYIMHFRPVRRATGKEANYRAGQV